VAAGDGGAVRTIQPADESALPTIRLAGKGALRIIGAQSREDD